jgi:hypothetical protein
MKPFDKLFKTKAQTIKIYLALEEVIDPYEKNVSLTYLNPIPIKAIVSDLTTSQLIWKLPGIRADKGKELLIKNKDFHLIEKSQKIEIEGEEYYGWKDNAGNRIQYIEEDQYYRLFIRLVE